MYKASGMLQNLVVSKTLDNVGSSRHFGQGQNIPADKEAPFFLPTETVWRPKTWENTAKIDCKNKISIKQ